MKCPICNGLVVTQEFSNGTRIHFDDCIFIGEELDEIDSYDVVYCEEFDKRYNIIGNLTSGTTIYSIDIEGTRQDTVFDSDTLFLPEIINETPQFIPLIRRLLSLRLFV
jgi:hypothetical protein